MVCSIDDVKCIKVTKMYHIAQKFDGENFDEWSTHKN